MTIAIVYFTLLMMKKFETHSGYRDCMQAQRHKSKQDVHQKVKEKHMQFQVSDEAANLRTSERSNKKVASRLVGSRIDQKLKDQDALIPEIDEDHFKVFRERSRVDLIPFSIVMLSRSVDGERSPQIGELVRNIIVAQWTGIMVIEQILKKCNDEAAKLMLDKFELVSRATDKAQQLRKQNINFSSDQFSYYRSPVSAAPSPKDKKLGKRINQFT
ncbi:MAG: hypothetical protein EZS28_015804 [Streblomastix strix]|uniref:Uncharacterized protein n=1 Tax=Streblomastix strix TaxID=222440 RepID=A0A5J4W150_9EUKA|nr:MAG: hypothetical protein EZS28_015804 [Streblomastix strix]